MERFAIRHPVSVLYSSKMVQFFSACPVLSSRRKYLQLMVTRVQN